MTTIYFIRHAEAEGNLYRIAQGQDNSALTDRGWRQVRALERRFADIPVDAVYASDLYRACATASALYQPKGLPLRRVPPLREIRVGLWEQKPWGEIYRRWPEEMVRFKTDPYAWRMEGAETAEEVVRRVLDALERVAAENEGKTAAVFCHGCAIRLTLARLQGIPPERVGETPTGDNTAVSLLEWEDGKWRVRFRDDSSHLETADYPAGTPVRRRASGLEPGLWYQSPAGQEAVWESLAACCPEGHARRGAALASGAALLALRGEEPVGALELGLETGRIALLCVRADCRRQGLGTQLLGQAIQKTRANGGRTLWLPLPEREDARRFFAAQGFTEGGGEAGCRLLKKDIGFDPAYL